MKKIEAIQNIMEANDTVAKRNRQLLDEHRVFAINIMSAPGAGKTSVILRTLAGLRGELNTGVIEGDVASTVDAEKVESAAQSVVQINTRNMPESCSLMAIMIEAALKDMPLDDIELVLVENVGNLICPSEFALGEHRRVVISSLPEGDDKPIKYPLIFSDADAVVINKIDLLPYVDFDMAAFRRSITGLNPGIRFFEVSCKTGEGIEEWCSWVSEQARAGAMNR
jgi:hydrogenase nickel incorporation protein HypB